MNGLRRFLIIWLILQAFACGDARGQVSAELLPDPIDSRDLTRLLKQHVAPSVDQWILIEDAHRSYLQRFADLAETEFARHRAYVEQHMSGVPDPPTIREFLRRLNSIRKVIAAEDDVFLLAIAEILDEEQQLGLMHIRNMRERDRLTVAYGSAANADQATPLWELLEQWLPGLTGEQRSLVALKLIDYEAGLIPELRVWRKAQDSILVALADQLAAAGIESFPPPGVDSEELDRSLALIREGLQAARRKMTTTAENLEASNLRLLRELELLLPGPTGRQIRMLYLVEKYPTGGIDPDPADLLASSRVLFADPNATPKLVESVREVIASYLNADERHLRRMTDVLERPDSDFPPGEPDRREQLDQISEVRSELAAQVVRSLHALVEHETDQRLARLFSTNGLRGYLASEVDEEDAPSYSEDIKGVDQTRGGPGDFIPQPISRRMVVELGELLDSESWISAILDTLYEDYLRDWNLRAEPLVAQCQEAESRTRGYDPDSGRIMVSRDALLESYRLAKLAVQVVEELDRSFFENLLVTLSGPLESNVRRVYFKRMLAGSLRGSDPIFNPRGVAFPTPNVLEVLETIALDRDEIDRIDAFLLESAPGLLARSMAARDVRFDSERRVHELNQRMMSRLSDGSATSSEYGVAYRALSDELLAVHGTQSRDWAVSYEAFSGGLADQLSPEHREGFDRLWMVASHPLVFRGALDAMPALQSALDLPDLSPEQVESISKAMVEYELAWRQLSEAMVEVDREMSGFGAQSDEADYERWRTLEQSFKSSAFNRDQAGMSALRQLYLYLTPEQRARVPALRGVEID